jgi:hypothetical protein
MRECLFCRENDEDGIIEHHTIPVRILPEWEETITLCRKCHRKVHKYILKDIIRQLTNERIELKEARKILYILGYQYKFTNNKVDRNIYIPTI